ncbi:MAG: DoxX family protein [Gammaproteobacteria bacterium]|nr:DoxX family protein [Gammaproteobacteria bacterium]
MDKLLDIGCRVAGALNRAGELLPQLGLRFLLAYEFWESGVMKLDATGGAGPAPEWFAGMDYPFPFGLLPATFNWILVMWTEIIGAVLLVIGLATRFVAIAFVILDVVAWVSVHAGNGYNVCDNGYKLPLMYLIMLLPLLFSGAGKASVDRFVARRFVGA